MFVISFTHFVITLRNERILVIYLPSLDEQWRFCFLFFTFPTLLFLVMKGIYCNFVCQMPFAGPGFAVEKANAFLQS